MTVLIIAFIVALALLYTWYKESRVFLFFLNKIVFPYRKGLPINIDKKTAFPQSSLLENNWKVIYQELNSVMQNSRALPKFHEVDRANYKISFDNAPAWRSIVIKGYDGWFTDNCNLFPQTTALLQKIPSVSTALFSILEPHVKIPRHSGKLSGILRYHLALAVPASDKCFIEVNGEKYCWKEGEGVLFNDTFPHSVTNDTDGYRIVLFLDVKKQSSAVVRALDNFILYTIRSSPTFKKALKTGKITTD